MEALEPVGHIQGGVDLGTALQGDVLLGGCHPSQDLGGLEAGVGSDLGHQG